VVLRLQGSGLCDLKPNRCVASDQIDSYLEPDRRSGITSPSVSLAEYLLVLRVYFPPVANDQFYFGCCKYCLLPAGDED
jgi:hypothetical protein